jgi:hypothetical protein
MGWSVLGLCFPRRAFIDHTIFCEVVCPSGEALRIAVDQTRPKISDVAFLDGAAAQRAMLVIAQHAIIDENESRCVRKSASGKTQIGVHDS